MNNIKKINIIISKIFNLKNKKRPLLYLRVFNLKRGNFLD
ncbi:hypothetical protein HMPREF1871_00850 [Gemelliphila asaccharolytica]|uniref:Uncharacterized protein n=1 Tax=Gemelliphila asaccharolytica TaxID=502393 RepID=A0ABR5TP37_9BACL|nr:hypothetical protein HMPREF1871_00850 [Gemella asaccharolytica]